MGDGGFSDQKRFGDYAVVLLAADFFSGVLCK
jgi:hypothetical protein